MSIGTARRLGEALIALRMSLWLALGVEGELLVRLFFTPWRSTYGTRDILYAIQRLILWPLGIHLNDASWLTWHDSIDRLLYPQGLPIGLGVSAALICVALYRRWFRAEFRRVVDRYRPTDACPACWYNLTGNETGVCPECGAIVEYSYDWQLRNAAPINHGRQDGQPIR